MQTNSIIQNNKTKKQFTQYVHGSLLSPVKNTLIDAIDSGNFTSWPEVTRKSVHNHLPSSEYTAISNLKRQRKNINSTKKHNDIDDFLDRHPPQENNNNETSSIFITIVTKNELKKAYLDQTGKFPFISSLGNNYVFVMYNYNKNTIFTKPLPSRWAKTIADAWKNVSNKLR